MSKRFKSYIFLAGLPLDCNSICQCQNDWDGQSNQIYNCYFNNLFNSFKWKYHNPIFAI